ncbi:MAG: DUF1648 domain-containing protein [Candidatus Omnitrophica bacterium]|nr:DUF1648 domain-containing protein [Candidatus Omnitrophota bacterium]
MRQAVLILVGILLFFLLHIALSSPVLPEHVATHFGADGQPNGWMSKTRYPFFIFLMGMGMAVFVLTIFFSIRFIPPAMINLPHKDYWLNDLRRAQTMRFIFQHGLWLAIIELLLVLSIHHTTVIVNRLKNPYLPPALAWGMLLIFLGAILAWGFVFIRAFFHVPEN